MRCGSRSNPPPPATRPRLTSGMPNADSVRGHDQVGGQRQFAATRQAIALNRRDQWFDRRTFGEAHAAALDHDVLAAREGLEVHPRAERSPGSGQHTDRQPGVVVEPVHRVGQSAAHLGVHGVLGLRPVDGDDQDPVALLDQDCLFAVVTHAADRNGPASSARGRCQRFLLPLPLPCLCLSVSSGGPCGSSTTGTEVGDGGGELTGGGGGTAVLLLTGCGD